MEVLYSYRELVTNQTPSKKGVEKPPSVDDLFQSLSRYVSGLMAYRNGRTTEAESIQPIARRFIKADRNPRVSHLQVQGIQFGMIDNTSIVLDTDFGILLSVPYTGKGVEPNLDCAVLGIDVVDIPMLTSFKNRGLNILSIREGDVIISQVQGNNRGEPALADYQWPRLLTTLAIDWAKQVGLTSLFFLPAKYQLYWPSQPDADMYRKSQQRRDRMKMLSDVTAKRSGFRKTSENGPYMLDIS